MRQAFANTAMDAGRRFHGVAIGEKLQVFGGRPGKHARAISSSDCTSKPLLQHFSRRIFSHCWKNYLVKIWIFILRSAAGINRERRGPEKVWQSLTAAPRVVRESFIRGISRLGLLFPIITVPSDLPHPAGTKKLGSGKYFLSSQHQRAHNRASCLCSPRRTSFTYYTAAPPYSA
jgi:hypothetical protein